MNDNPRRRLHRAVTACGAALAGCVAIALFACAQVAPLKLTGEPVIGQQVLGLLPTQALLFGEQHDAPEHAELALKTVMALTQANALATFALEMADSPASTADLKPDASEAAVQAALKWQNEAWPWARYGPVVMAAVRAGVPVLGANLARTQMREAMQNAALDTRLDASALAAQRQAIIQGHCSLLPDAQIPGMTRIQIARDVAMARTVAQAARPGQTVLLLAGAAHVSRALGVPLHLPPEFRLKVLVAQVDTAQAAIKNEAAIDLLWITPALPPTDYCAQLRQQPRAGKP